MMDRWHWKPWAVLALAGLLVAGRAADLSRLFFAGTLPRSPGYDVALRDGRLVVTGVIPSDFGGKAPPGAAAGLKPGDEIISLAGSGRRFDVHSLAQYGDALRQIDRKVPWQLEVKRAGSGQRASLTVPPFQPSRMQIVLLLLTDAILPLLAIGTAVLTVLLRPNNRIALLGGLMFLSCSTVFALEFLTLPRLLRLPLALASSGLAGFGVYFFMRFFLVFPARSAIDRLAPWLKHALLWPTAFVAGFSMLMALALLTPVGVLARLQYIDPPPAVGTVLLVFYASMIVIGLAALVSQALGGRTPGERRRLLVLVTGALIGLLPLFTSLIVLPFSDSTVPPLWVLVMVLLTLPVFPLSFVYSVVKHRVLGVDVIVRRGLQYALLTRTLVFIEGAVVFAVLWYSAGPLAARAMPALGTTASIGLVAAATLVAMLAIRRINRWLQPALDRKFFRGSYDPQGLLSDLSAALKRTAARPAEVPQEVANAIARALHPKHVGLWLDVAVGRGLDGDRRTDGSSGFSCVRWFIADDRSGRLSALPLPDIGVMPRDGPLASWLGAHAAQRVEAFDIDPQKRAPWAKRSADAADGVLADYAFRDLDVHLLVPLATNEGLLGWLTLGDKLSEEGYSASDKSLLRAIAEQMAVALDYALLIGRVAEQEALKREMEIARDVQVGLFPRARPAVAGLDCDGWCRTAQDVGGDTFDFIELGDNAIGVAIADISGKGVSAALLMASLQAMLRSRAPFAGNDLGGLTQAINDLIVRSTSRRRTFATFFYGVIDAGRRHLHYVNAGHNPPLLLPAGTTEAQWLGPSGIGLGLAKGSVYGTRDAGLTNGDVLLLFTDGVTEAFAPDGDQYGEARLFDLVASHRHQSAPQIKDAVLADVTRFTHPGLPHDDLTVVVVKVS